MATYTANLNVQPASRLVLDVWESSVDTANNRSTVNWSVKIERTDNWVWSTYDWNYWVDGSTQSGQINIQLGNGQPTYYIINSGSKVVTHDGDGSKNIWCEASITGNMDGSAYIGVTFALTKINTAAKIASLTGTYDLTIGTVATITRTAPSDSDTWNSFWWRVGTSGWVRVPELDGFNSGATWTPPTDIANYMGGAGVVTGELLIETISDRGAYIGSPGGKSATFSKPDRSPTIGAVTIEETVASVTGQLAANTFLQNVSKPKFTYTATPKYTATIASYSISIDGVIYSGANPIVGPITKSGTIPYTITVVDSTGADSSITGNITVLNYNPPSISAVQASRLTSGTTGKLTANLAITSVKNGTTEKNKFASVTLNYRKKNNPTWIPLTSDTTIPGLSYSYNKEWTVEEASVYEVRLDVQDTFSGQPSIVVDMPVGNTLLSLGKAGVAFGKLWEAGRGALDVLGTTFMSVPAGVTEALNVTGTTSLTGDTTITGNLNVNGAVTKSGIVLNPGIKYYNNSTQAFAAASIVNTLLPAVDWSDTGHGTTYVVNNGGRVYFSVAGRYIIIGQVAIADWGAGGTGEIGIAKSGVVQQTTTSASCYYWKGEVTTILDIAADDYIRLFFRPSTACTSEANGIKLTIIKLA